MTRTPKSIEMHLNTRVTHASPMYPTTKGFFYSAKALDSASPYEQTIPCVVGQSAPPTEVPKNLQAPGGWSYVRRVGFEPTTSGLLTLRLYLGLESQRPNVLLGYLPLLNSECAYASSLIQLHYLRLRRLRQVLRVQRLDGNNLV